VGTKKFPLIEMEWSRLDCLKYLKSIGMEDVGKSACVFCPYASNEQFLELKQNDPEGWELAVYIDEQIRTMGKGKDREFYIHSSCVPLKDVDFENKQKELFDAFDNECDGMCGL